MAEKRSFNWRKIFKSGSTSQNKATRNMENSTGILPQVPGPVYSGQILAGAHHFSMDNPNFTSVQTQYVTVNNPSGISGGTTLERLESQVLVCPSPSPHFTGREDILAQLSDIFSPAVVTLYSPKEEELAKFIRNHIKWYGSLIIINGKSAKDLTEGIAKNLKEPESLVADTILVIENMDPTLRISDYLPPWVNVHALITGTNMEIIEGEYRRNSFHLPNDTNQTELEQLKNSLKELLCVKQNIVTLVAAGGTGKTQVVLKFIAKIRTRNVWFFDASSEARLIQNFKELGKALRIPEDVATVQRFLTTVKHSWICIFDNADDRELLQGLVRNYLPIGNHGGIIITSRLREAMQLVTSPNCNIIFGDLDEASAIKLLLKHAHEGTSEDNSKLAGQIVNALECQALAVCTAGAYIHATITCSLDIYYLEFKKQSKKTLKYKMTGGSYPRTVLNAFMLSFEQLTGPAQLLLQICSCLHPTAIPVEMFENALSSGFTEDEFHETEKNIAGRAAMNEYISCLKQIDLLEIIDELGKWSLLSYNVNHNGKTLTYHAVIHSCAYETISSKDKMVSAVTLLLSSGTPIDSSEHGYALRRRLLTHASYISMDRLVNLTMEGQGRVAQVFEESGYWVQAEKMHEHIWLQYSDVLGEHDPDTLISMNNLASTYQACGKPKHAEQLKEKVLSLQKELLGEHHPDTLTSMNNLACTYEVNGKAEQAEKMLEKVLSLWKGLLGGHDPNTLTSMNNLASTYQARGKTKQAEQLKEKVLALQKELLGEHHPDTLTSMNNLACTYEVHGKTAQAEKVLENVVSLRREVLGEHHPDTLTSINNLASTYQVGGKTEQAEKLHEAVLSLQTELLGEHHPDTLTSMNNLASTYEARGKTEQAEKMQEKALSLQKEVLGEFHPDTLTSINNLALTYMARGKTEQAENLQQKVLSLRKELLGEHHPDTLNSMNNLALTCYARGNTEQAERILEKVVSLQKEILGEHHPDTLNSMNNLASTYSAHGKPEQADRMQEEVLSLRKTLLGEHHPHTLNSMNNLALTHKARGMTEQAERMQEKVLLLQKELLGENHPDTLTSMSNLAMTYADNGRIEHVEEMLERVLFLRKELLGEHHPDTLTSISNLAVTYEDNGKTEQVEKMLEKVLSLRKELLGEHHPDTLVSMHNLAFIYRARGEIEHAEKLQEKMLILQKELLGENHPDTSISMSHLVSTY
ncbi:hypothetical protein D9757_011637 [Collybiopsis confluens]|uniref:TPR-like protein n=1 Tax=Collybiopsis confluens TaxID=2823264 RepID=A0A8H5GWS8_9AGAR|nr:hypothetical protein D9757_011637 [Collybiopsis confluens]